MGKHFFDSDVDNAVDRVDAKAKVTGKARYAAEYKPGELTYGVLVTSTIARGRITGIDTKKAVAVPGVITVITHLNRPEVPGWETASGGGRVQGREFRVFENAEIYFDHQPVALVIADTLEQASEAAPLVKVTYNKEVPHTDLIENLTKAVKPQRSEDYRRGTENAWETATVKIESEYTTPIQVHNPMEMHAATVHWKSSAAVMHYNKTQAVKYAQRDIVNAFNLKEENVEVHSPYVGGAFGSASRIWPEEMAAIIGAKKTGRPLVVMARRDQVFNMVGYRPASYQKLAVGAGPDGTLVGIKHDSIGSTSSYEVFPERINEVTESLYACPNMSTSYKVVPLDMSTPCWTRGPGETSGSFALESAIDEISYKLGMDPLAVRLKNFAAKDPKNGQPWSSNYLMDCYKQGAEAFGWDKRKPQPRSMKQGEWLLGMGMASGIYKAGRSPATASAMLKSDGSFLVQTSVADVGPGSATVMTQIAAEALGVNPDSINFEWGNSSLPPAPGQFGSHTTASTGSAVHDACKALQQTLKEKLVSTPGTAYSGKSVNDLIFEKDKLAVKGSGDSLGYADLLKQANLPELKVTKESRSGPEGDRYSGKSFAAHFVEVLVHPHTGVIRINRVVSAVDAGKIVNQKTARSQVYGSVAWGIGIALMEEGILDHRYGRYVNNDFSDYHIPVNADIPPIDVIFIDKPDPVLDPMGAKGLGEIGLVGFTGAVANAVFHATGKRVRSLPITVDKLV